MNEVREFVGIADKEDRRVVADKIPVAFLGIEFEGKSAHIPFGIGGAALTGDSGETEEALGLLAGGGEDRGFGVFGDVVGHGKGAIGGGAFGMDDALRDPLTVEVGVFLEKLPVLHQQRTPRSGGQSILVVADGNAG